MSDIGKKRLDQKRSRHRRARYRIRQKIKGTAERPRLAVHKSAKYIYAQVIDDGAGRTVAQASSQEPGLRSELSGATGNREAAKKVGELVAQRALDQGVAKVVFDRGGYIYHGKVQALAEAAREKGLQF